VNTYTYLNPMMRLNPIRHGREMCIPIIPSLFILFYFLFYFIYFICISWFVFFSLGCNKLCKLFIASCSL